MTTDLICAMHRSGRRKSHAPAAGTVPAFVHHIGTLINAAEKTQRQIAYEIGYDKPNMITMFKQGITRVPAEKVAPLACALGEDPVCLLRLWLLEYEPDLLEAIEGHLGLLLTPEERSLISKLRQRPPEGPE